MAASTREVFLLLKARDEASRVLRGFGAEVAKSSNTIRAAAMRQQAIAMQEEVTERRRRSALASRMVMEKQLRAINIDKQIAQARTTGATNAYVQALRTQAVALRREANEISTTQRAYDKKTSTILANIRALDRQSSELERADRAERSFGAAMASAGQGLATLAVGFIGVGVLSANFFYDSFQGWMEYQRQVQLTHTQIDGFTASVEQLGDIGLRIANEIPVAFEQIQPALFDIFSSTSANLGQAEILLEGFSKAAVAGQTDIQTAARGTMAIMNAYNEPFENVNDILDIQFELVRKGVGTYAEFAKVFGRVVPAATRSQQSFETVAAMLAYMTRNGQSAAQASTAAARALELFTHPRAIEQLDKLGIKVKDQKGNFRPLIGILQDLRKELLKMPQADRVKAIVTAFKGSGFNIQARRFLEQVVLGPGELEDFEAMLKSMGNASGVLEDKYSEMADTAAAKTQLLANKWEVLKIAVGEAAAPAILKVVDALTLLLDKFNKLDPKTKELIIQIGIFSTVLLIATGVGLGFLAALVLIAGALALVTGEMLIIVGITLLVIGLFIALGIAMAILYNKSEPVRKLFNGIKTAFLEMWHVLQEGLQILKDEFEAKLLPTLMKLWNWIETRLLPTIQKFRDEVWNELKPKLEEAFRIIGDMAGWAFGVLAEIIDKVLIPYLEELVRWWEKNEEEIKPLLWIIGQVVKWLLIIAAVIIGVLIVVFVGPLVVAILVVVAAFQLIVEIWKIIKGAFMAIVNAVNYVVTALTETGKLIKKWFDDQKTAFLNAGMNMITALIAGIKAKLGPLGTIMSTVGNTISNFLQHSPAKKGPLSGKGYTYYSGVSVATALAAGIQSQLGTVAAASGQMASMVADPLMGGFGAPVGFVSAPEAGFAGVNKTNYVTVNVNTNEIDPRTQAAELGWELAGRLD